MSRNEAAVIITVELSRDEATSLRVFSFAEKASRYQHASLHRASIVLVGGLAIWFCIVWLMFDRSSIRGELYALRKERRREERNGRLLGDAITP